MAETSSDEVLEAITLASRRLEDIMKSLALDVKSLALALALVLDLKSLTIGCRIITLLFVIFQWNRIRELEQKTFAFTLLLLGSISSSFIIINTHCWLPLNIYVIESDLVLVRHSLDVGLDLDL